MACSVNMSFQVLHTKMPDRNYAFYQGPMLNGKGLGTNSTRGATGKAPFVNAGPLITTGAAGDGKNGLSTNPNIVVNQGHQQEMYINQIAGSVADDFVNSLGY